MQKTVVVTKAPTLKDLYDQVGEAIKILGADAEWAGHNSGTICIWGQTRWLFLAIEPQSTKEGLNGDAKTGSEATENNRSLPYPHSRERSSRKAGD
jgi:hypothetical protein